MPIWCVGFLMNLSNPINYKKYKDYSCLAREMPTMHRRVGCSDPFYRRIGLFEFSAEQEIEKDETCNRNHQALQAG